MQSEIIRCRQVAEETAMKIAGNWEEWTKYLKAAARLYKYPFHQQLLIYAQCPEATACASFDVWNKRLGRYVEKGAKGIAILDEVDGKPELRYVFDIKDTGVRESSKTPWIWTLEEPYKKSVSMMLEDFYGIDSDELGRQLERVSEKLSREYWKENRRDILYAAKGSLLEELDEDNIEVWFKSMSQNSVAYTLMSRCGLRPEEYFESDDFWRLLDFSSVHSIGALGTAVSDISRQVLRNIENTIRIEITERRNNHEQRVEVHSAGGLSDSQLEPGTAAGGSSGQIRKNAKRLPEGIPADSVQSTAFGGRIVSAPHQDGSVGPTTVGTDNSPVGRGSRSDGRDEKQRAYQVGRADEHLPGTGGGNYSGRTDLQLSNSEEIEKEVENDQSSSASSFLSPNQSFNSVSDSSVPVEGEETSSRAENVSSVSPIILTSEKAADKVKEITARLEEGILAIFDSEKYRMFLTAMSRFHNYSLNNTILIAMQGGRLVAGYTKWKNEFHRNVKKGEKGIKIFAPSPYKVKKEVPKLDDQGQPVKDSAGKIITEKKEIKVPAFKVVSVFDISQTEGEPLPTLGVEELTGNVEHFQKFFRALEQTSPVPIAFENIEGEAHGYYHLTERRIAIQENMSELQTLKTVIHEIAHAKLHAIDPELPVTEQTNRPDRRTREVQAESVAYTVCQHYGLDTSDYSFAYVAGWSTGKELKELKSSLETIQATAHELITTIDNHLAENQQQERSEEYKMSNEIEDNQRKNYAQLTPEEKVELLKDKSNFADFLLFTASDSNLESDEIYAEDIDELVRKWCEQRDTIPAPNVLPEENEAILNGVLCEKYRLTDEGMEANLQRAFGKMMDGEDLPPEYRAVERGAATVALAGAYGMDMPGTVSQTMDGLKNLSVDYESIKDMMAYALSSAAVLKDTINTAYETDLYFASQDIAPRPDDGFAIDIT